MTNMTVSENAKEAARQIYKTAIYSNETQHNDTERFASFVQAAIDAEIGRLKERCEHWIKDAQDAVNGVYGDNPKGEPQDYWRGRVAALTDIHAFIPPTRF